MNGFNAPRRSVYIIAADPFAALELVSRITSLGATYYLDNVTISAPRDSERHDIVPQLYVALNAADEILVLLTPTPPGLLQRKSLWLGLAIGWASARGKPIIGLLYRVTREELSEELSADGDFLTISGLLEYHDLKSYITRLGQRLKASPGRPSPEISEEERKGSGEGVYNVFLCYNSEDEEAVMAVGEKLKALGLKPWLDVWESRPGRSWQEVLKEQIQSIKSAAVFIGKNGVAHWQGVEKAEILREFVRRSCPVIPVILRDYGKGTPHLDPWLSKLTWVDFRKRIPDPLKQLHWGISGYNEFPPSGGSCFISYSTKDVKFAERLRSRMVQEKLRVWFARDDMKAGLPHDDQIDEAIRVYDKMLLVLSKASMASKWVRREIRKARETEKREERRKLFPIRLVGMEVVKAWECVDPRTGQDYAEEVLRYYIPDFTNWKDPDSFEAGFAKLLRDLKAGDSIAP